MKPEKKNIKCNIITQAYRSRCSSETHQVIKTFRIVQQGEVSLTKSSLFLKTMISDFFLSSGAFLNHNPINKPAKNNKRMLISAVFNFFRSRAKRQVKTLQDDTKLCQLQLSGKKSRMLHKFST